MLLASNYLQWGVLQISLANLVVIAVMVVLFVLALVLPFPGHRADHQKGPTDVRH